MVGGQGLGPNIAKRTEKAGLIVLHLSAEPSACTRNEHATCTSDTCIVRCFALFLEAKN